MTSRSRQQISEQQADISAHSNLAGMSNRSSQLRDKYRLGQGGISTGNKSNVTSQASMISNQVSPINQFDLITLLQASHQLTSRQKQLLIAIQQSDTQYLLDMDVMQQENFEIFNFTFSEFQITPLMLACAVGNLNVAAIMVEGPLDKTLNHKDSQGFNALYYAVYHGHLPIVKLLKRLMINYDTDAKGTTCLHIAIMRGHLDIVQFLLTKTPEIVAQSLKEKVEKSNKTKKDQEELEKEQKLINRTNKARQWEQLIDVDEQRDKNGISTVFFAIRSGQVPMLQLLRKYGANFNLECVSESNQKMRPIQYVIYRSNFEMYKLILEYNSDILDSQFSAQMSATGSSLLHLCAFKGNTSILKDLLEKNMNPFIANKQGDTCLHVAIRKRNYDFCMELVRWAVSKNITASQAEVENTTESLTPFMTAVLRDQFEIATLLLKNNLATRGYVNREGRDLKQIAVDNNRERALAYLENRDGAPVHGLKRDNSIDQVYQNPGNKSKMISSKRIQPENHKSFTNRKASVDPIAHKRDDIFGNSLTQELYDRKAQQENLIMKSEVNMPHEKSLEESKDPKPIRLLKTSAQQSYNNTGNEGDGIPSIKHNQRDYGTEQHALSPLKTLKGGKHKSTKSEHSLSQASSHRSSQQSNLRQLASPGGGIIRANKMPKLDLVNDDVDKVNVRDFIKQSKR